MSKSKRNGSEAKFYPDTYTDIDKALSSAKRMNDNPHFAGILTAATSARLNSLHPAFQQAEQEVANKKVAFGTLIRQKEKARTDTLLHTSHFLQVLNLGIQRGKYAAADRVLFGMHVSSGALPRLKGDMHMEIAAEQVVDGEAQRIAQGKTPVSNPSGAEVEAVFSQYTTLKLQASNANDAYGDAQKELRELFKEARKLVKRIWHEIETHYNNGDRERMRKLAREWGVHYARKGGEKTVTGTVTDAATGAPVIGAKVKFANGKNKALTGADGRFKLITNLMHSQTLLASRINYDTGEVVVELKEGETTQCEVKMVRVE